MISGIKYLVFIDLLINTARKGSIGIKYLISLCWNNWKKQNKIIKGIKNHKSFLLYSYLNKNNKNIIPKPKIIGIELKYNQKLEGLDAHNNANLKASNPI
jgi:hypothetical protein